MKVLICYYSTYGNVYKMANLVAEGVSQIVGAEPVVRTVPELIHLGMILVGVPYSVQELFTTQGGGSPYGPGHLAGGDNRREIDPHEAAICRALGRRLAEVVLRLRTK